MSNRPHHDVVVVGAGPAGSQCAERLARAGHGVILVDKRREVGVPSHCAGIIRQSSLAAFGLERGPWVRREFAAYVVAGPDDSRVSYATPEPGALLHRHLLDQELCRRAVEAGAELRLESAVTGVIQESGRVAGVQIGAARAEIRARFVVAADGVASRVGKMAGLETRPTDGGLAVAAKATLHQPGASVDDCHLYLGRSVAPGGYLWLLPRADGIIDIGAGINPLHARGVSPLATMREFAAARFPGAELRDVFSHALSAEPSAIPHYAPGLVLAGEAARQTNPMTGAGIFTAMSSGAMAGDFLVEALRTGSDRALRQEYAARWEQQFGAFNRMSFELRRRLDRVSDEALCRAIGSLAPSQNRPSVAHALMEITELAERADGASARESWAS